MTIGLRLAHNTIMANLCAENVKQYCISIVCKLCVYGATIGMEWKLGRQIARRMSTMRMKLAAIAAAAYRYRGYNKKK